jgi:hypothetical protein
MAKRRKRKIYDGNSVTIAKSREEIDTILRKWGVSGILWEDNFGKGTVSLRFRWKNDEVEYVARYQIQLDSDEELKELAIDGRSGIFSQKKLDRLLADRGKREHKNLAAFLKNVFEAVDQGVIDAQAVFLPWLEDGEGRTVYERIGPVMKQMGSMTLPRALKDGVE